MARLLTAGAEIRDTPTSDVGSPDGYSGGAAATVRDTTTFRSGLAAYQCPGTSANSSFQIFPFTAPASGQTVFTRGYWWTDTLPSATKKVASLVTSAGGALISARITSAGVLQLWNDVAGTQIGSDTVLTVEVNRIYRLQLRLLIDAGAADEAELLVKTDDYQAVDESVAGTGLTVSDTHASRLNVGWVDAPGVTSTAWADDVAVNDSTGTKQTSWALEGRAGYAPADSTFSAGSWTDCSGAANPHDGANKLPPVGLADHTTAGHTGASAHQARVAANTSQSMQLNLKALASVGAIQPLNNLAGSTTGSLTTQIGSSASQNRRAQSFKFGSSVTVDALVLKLNRTGSPSDNLLVEIQGDSGGLPSGTTLESAPAYPAASAPTPAGLVTFRLSSPLPLTAGTTYWIVVSRSGAVDAANFVSWLLNAPTGLAYGDGETAVHNGTSWLKSGTNRSATDHVFEVRITQGYWPPTVFTLAVCHGQAATGTRTGSFSSGSPAITATTFNFGNTAVAGTYPTGWAWSKSSTTLYSPVVDNAANFRLTVIKDSGSGSTGCMVCAAGVVFEYTLPPIGWSRWQKTADSTFWWAKRSIGEIAVELTGGTVLTVPAGDWLIYPEPQIAEGADFPTTTVTVTDSVLQAGYVAA